MTQEPIVSVVVPTRNRPTLVVRAVLSALAQTLTSLEVMVVIDGPDDVTAHALAEICDTRVTVISLPSPLGGSEARNVGVQHSRADFIAFLDDDDEWSPSKLERQLDMARQSTSLFPVVTCRIIARRPIGDEIWPARQMKQHEAMSEYLLCREASIRQGEGFIQTSSLFVPKRLMIRVPFTKGLPRHQDWDWLIRVALYPGVEFLWVWQPLVIYHIDAARKSISAGRSLDASISWAKGSGLLTPKAQAYFYATQVAVRCNTPRVFWSILYHTLRYPRAFFIAMGLAFTPRSFVYSLRLRSSSTLA